MNDSSFSYSRVFASACISLLAFGVGVTSLGSVLPVLIERFSLSDLEAGALTSLLPAGILGGSLFFGPIVDRYSYRLLLSVCLLLLGAGLSGIALSPSFFGVQISFVLIGLSGGAINGAGSALIADISTKRPGGPGAALSLLGVFFGVGALGMPAVLGFFSRWYSVEVILPAIGLFIGCSAVYLLLTRFPKAKHAKGFPIQEGLSLLRQLPLIALGFVLFFQSGMEGLVNGWSPTFLQAARHLEPAAALGILSLSVLGLTLMRMLLSGVLRRVRPYQVMGGSMAFTLAGSLLLLQSGGQVQASAGFFLLGLGLAGGFPIILGYVGQLYLHLSGTALGLALAIAVSGNVVFNFTMGLLAERFGMEVYPLLILACLAAQTILLLFSLRAIYPKIHI